MPEQTEIRRIVFCRDSSLTCDIRNEFLYLYSRKSGEHVNG